MILKGELYAASALVNSLRGNLNPKVDFYIIRHVDHLESNIKKLLMNSNEIIPLETRSYFYSVEVNNKSEDPLGDILDQAQISGMDYFYELKSKGLMGLIPQVLGLPLSYKGLYLGPSRNEMILINSGNIRCIDKGISSTLRKLIKQLEGIEFKSKEFLISSVWGYQYDPQIHDNLLHSSIGKIRGILNEYSAWIEWSNEGYRLNPNIRIKEAQEAKLIQIIEAETQKKNEIVNNIPFKDKKYLELNVRQLKLIKMLKSEDFIGVSEYAKRFRVCKMTACRDLTSLHRFGFMLRVGKGRATAYGLAQMEMFK